MSIVLDIVAGNWCPQLVLWNAHAIEQVLTLIGNLCNQCHARIKQFLLSLLANDSLQNVESQVAVDNFSCEETEHLRQNSLVRRIIQSVNNVDAVLQCLTLTESEGQILHNVGRLTHQDLVTGLTLLLEGFLVSLPLLEQHDFSEFEEIQEDVECRDVLSFCNLAHWAHCHFRQFVTILQDVFLHIFADLDHENAVVALGSKCCVCNSQVITKLVD